MIHNYGFTLCTIYVLFIFTPLVCCMSAVSLGGGIGNDQLLKLDMDSNGTIYGGGYFYGSSIIGSLSWSVDDQETGYVVAYNSDLTPLWTKFVSGVSDERVTAVSVNLPIIYVTGYSTSSAFAVDSTTIQNTDFPNTGLFVAKLNVVNGSVIWANCTSSSGVVISNDIASDSTKVCVVGFYAGTDVSVGGSVFPSSDENDWMIACYHDNRTHYWSVGISGLGMDEARSVAIHSDSGRVFVMGTIESDLTFEGFGSPQYISCPNCTYLIIFEDNGGVFNTRIIEGNRTLDFWDFVVGESVAYLVGSCLSSFFDNTPVPCSDEGTDALVIEYSFDFNFTSHHSFLTEGNQEIRSAFLYGQQLVLAGTYDGSPDFGKGHLPSSITNGTFVASFNTLDFSLNWNVGYPANSPNQIHPTSVSLGDTGFVLGGYYEGDITLETVSLSSNGSTDGYIAISATPSPIPNPSSTPFGTSASPSAPPQEDSSSTIPPEVVAAAAGSGGGVCIIVVVVAAVFWIRRKKPKTDSDTSSYSDMEEITTL